tara:strand:+ start:2437 stop:3051 length:615 start_codon:yes stop_codon:yes gene_type:complete
MIMIQPYDAYSYYMAIKLHFERDSYDALKYNFKSSATQKSFMVRKDKYHFAKISKKFVDSKELVAYYVSNFVRGSKWVGDMLEHGDENYSAWKRYSESMTYRFTSDIDVLVDYIEGKGLKFDDLFLTTEDGGSHPPIIRLLLQEDVSLETVVLLDKMLGFTKRFDKTISETLVWPDLSMRIRKYKPFVNADLTALKKIVLQKLA